MNWQNTTLTLILGLTKGQLNRGVYLMRGQNHHDVLFVTGKGCEYASRRSRQSGVQAIHCGSGCVFRSDEV